MGKFVLLKGIRKSIVFRVFMGVLVVILPINILMIISAQLFFDATKQQSLLEAEHALNFYMNQIETQMERMEYFINDETATVDYLRIVDADTSTSKKQYDYVKAQIAFRDHMSEAIVVNSLIDGGFGYFLKNEMIILAHDSRTEYDIGTFIGDYIREIEQNKKVPRVYWEPIEFSGKHYLFYINKKLDSYYGAWIDVNKMVEDLSVGNEETNFVHYFEDKQGNIISSNFSDLNGAETDIAGETCNQTENSSCQKISVAGENGLRLVQLIPKNRALEAVPNIARVLQAFSIVCLLVIPIIAYIIKHQIMKPVNALLRAIGHINRGDLDYRIEERGSSNEFFKINHSFNKMMEQIKTLKIDVYESELERQRIKLGYLSHQVQPHFTLNNLNIVYSYEKDEYELIQQMIMNLIRYFRYIVRVDAPFVPLKQEIDHIKNYLEIQRVRYPDSFHAQIKCEPSLEKCLIPPLIVQNFVENAFKNAFDIDNGITIIVEVKYYDDEYAVITVKDSGKGFPARVLEAIEIFKSTRVAKSCLGVGIPNSIERMAILYNDISAIEFANNDEGGAAVTITIPICH